MSDVCTKSCLNCAFLATVQPTHMPVGPEANYFALSQKNRDAFRSGNSCITNVELGCAEGEWRHPYNESDRLWKALLPELKKDRAKCRFFSDFQEGRTIEAARKSKAGQESEVDRGIAKEANDIARDANSISRRASTMAKIAIGISIVAAIAEVGQCYYQRPAPTDSTPVIAPTVAQPAVKSK